MDILRGKITAPQFQNWPATAIILPLVAFAILVLSATRRPAFPKAAPRLVDREGYPVLGMLRFFSERRNFTRDAAMASKSGHYSFHFGKFPIVGVSGLEGRRTFFESRDLNMSEGYAALFALAPEVGDARKGEDSISLNRYFTQTLVTLMRKENFVRNLPQLVGDTRTQLSSLAACNGGSRTGVFDPFEDITRIVYQLTMRTVGADEIAESPELLKTTLAQFETLEASSSPARMIIPYLPTPNYVRRLIAGFRLFRVFKRIIDGRKKSDRRAKDALQFLLDRGDSVVKILTFVLSALFAGQLNSGINAAWFFVYLACNPDWYSRVQNEVDEAVRRHRTSPSQSAGDILGSLTIEDWESEFPLIDLCLRECIRFQLVGTAFRKNISNKDVPIGNSGEVVPRGAFAVYLIDDVHMNADLYADPEYWDPGRYLPERAEDKKAPLSYVGWGTGRHPCLGMRFAKLEMGIIAAMFVSMFDFELLNGKGEKLNRAPPTNRNRLSASGPDEAVRIRYTVRQQ